MYTQSDLVELLEINFEVVSFINSNLDRPKIQHIEQMQGIGGIYELAEDMTIKFFNEVRAGDDDGEGIKDGEFFDKIHYFLIGQLN